MTSVIVAVVAGLTGVLAGLLPSLLISPRRRMLRIMAEEKALLDGVEDVRTVKHLTAALRQSSARYRTWVRVDPHLRSRRIGLQVVPLLLLLGATYAAIYLINATVDGYVWVTAVAVTLSTLCALAVLFLSTFLLIQTVNNAANYREDALMKNKRMERRVVRVIERRLQRQQELIEAGAPVDQLEEAEASLADGRQLLAEVREARVSVDAIGDDPTWISLRRPRWLSRNRGA